MSAPAPDVSADWRMFEQPLTDQQRILRDQFVNEYLKDMDPYQACLRVGFQSTFAVDWAKRFMDEGYVQRAIAHFTRLPAQDEAKAIESDRALVLATYREASVRGPYASRVAAANALAKMRGFQPADNGEDPNDNLIDVLKGFAQSAPV